MLINALVQLYAFALSFQLFPFLIYQSQDAGYRPVMERAEKHLLLLYKVDAMAWNFHGLYLASSVHSKLETTVFYTVYQSGEVNPKVLEVSKVYFLLAPSESVTFLLMSS